MGCEKQSGFPELESADVQPQRGERTKMRDDGGKVLARGI